MSRIAPRHERVSRLVLFDGGIDVRRGVGPGDSLMTEGEALAMAAAIPACRLVTVPSSNHSTVLLGETPEVKSALRAFLAGG